MNDSVNIELSHTECKELRVSYLTAAAAAVAAAHELPDTKE
jgi:hypothetical protein